MKKFSLLATVLLFVPLTCLAQTTASIQGNLKTILGENLGSRTFIQFRLRHSDGSFPVAPRVVGVGAIVQTTKRVKPDSNGLISTTLYRNDAIEPAGTFWVFEYHFNGRFQFSQNFNITTATLDFNTATPIIVTASTALIDSIIRQDYTQFFTSQTVWTINHNFNSTNVICHFFDIIGDLFYPGSSVPTDVNTWTGTFITAESGKATCSSNGLFSFTNELTQVLNLNPGGSQTGGNGQLFTWDGVIGPVDTTDTLGTGSNRWGNIFAEAMTPAAVNNLIHVDGNKYAATPAGLQAAIDALTTGEHNAAGVDASGLNGAQTITSTIIDNSAVGTRRFSGVNFTSTGQTAFTLTGGNSTKRYIGASSSTRIQATGAHTFTITATSKDNTLDNLWVDQTDASGSFDAFNLLGVKTKIRGSYTDFAPRYGIFVGANQTQIESYQCQATLLACVFIDTAPTLNTSSDVLVFVGAGDNPGSGFNVDGSRNGFSNILGSTLDGYLMRLNGLYNVASGLSGINVGGATEEDFLRVPGAFNATVNAISRATTGVAFNVTGNSTSTLGALSDNSTKEGLIMGGSGGLFSGRLFNCGTGGTFDCVSVSGNNNNVTAVTGTATGDDVDVSGNKNTLYVNSAGNVAVSGDDNNIYGYIGGNLTFATAADDNAFVGTLVGTAVDNSTNKRNKVSAGRLVDFLETARANQPRWIYKKVEHTDMTAAATADTFVLWALPANTIIHDVVGNVTAAWAGTGPVTVAVCSVGTAAGSENDLALDDDFFSTGRKYELHDGTANGGKGTLLFDATDKFAPTFFATAGNIEIQCDLTGGNHSTTTAGSANIYILVSQPFSNTSKEAN